MKLHFLPWIATNFNLVNKSIVFVALSSCKYARSRCTVAASYKHTHNYYFLFIQLLFLVHRKLIDFIFFGQNYPNLINFTLCSNLLGACEAAGKLTEKGLIQIINREKDLWVINRVFIVALIRVDGLSLVTFFYRFSAEKEEDVRESETLIWLSFDWVQTSWSRWWAL